MYCRSAVYMCVQLPLLDRKSLPVNGRSTVQNDPDDL